MRSDAETETETLIPTIGGVFDVAHSLKADGFDASEDGTGRGTPIAPVAFQTNGNCGAWETGEITGALDTGTDPNSHVLCFSAKDHGADAMENLSPTLRAGGHSASHANAGVMPAIAIQERAVCENPDAGPDGIGVRDDGVAYTLEARQQVQAVAFDTTQITSAANFSNPKPGDPCHPLASGAHPPAVAFDMRGREGGAQFEGPHETANIRAASGGSSKSYVADKWAVRRLTPMECERLQGFPDGWTQVEYRGKPAADGPRYKAIGNSMAVNVMRWIGKRIQLIDDFMEVL